ncbi:SDR family oxidoreductase [Paenibacillus sp. y28]|uniref:SDR family oxidoreductase n=1 Tax=Paenibacillus sp. y28 TaxID=3129110 RepID=UPI00301AB37A
MKILVTGATGQLGALVVEKLLQTVPAANIAVSVRDTDKAAHLQAKGVDVRQGDFDQPQTLEKAFAGVDRLLLISTAGENRVAQHQAAIDAAKQSGVRFIAYTSIVNAQDSTADLASDHRSTEQLIRASGIPYSFLRNNWYIENETGSIQAVMQGAPWVHATDTAKIGWAARRDYAHAAAAVLAGEGHENTIYELSGPLRTLDELVELVQEVLGQEIQIQNVSDAAYAEMLRGTGLPDFLVDIFTDMQKAIRHGALAVEGADLEKLLGRPVQPLREAIRVIAGK